MIYNEIFLWPLDGFFFSPEKKKKERRRPVRLIVARLRFKKINFLADPKTLCKEKSKEKISFS
jgi:hypothetical protein